MNSHFTRGFTVRKSNFRLRKMYFHDSHFPLLKSQSCESAEGPAVAGCCCWAAMHSNLSKTVKWDSHFTLHFFQMWTVNRTWTVNYFFDKMRSWTLVCTRSYDPGKKISDVSECKCKRRQLISKRGERGFLSSFLLSEVLFLLGSSVRNSELRTTDPILLHQKG